MNKKLFEMPRVEVASFSVFFDKVSNIHKRAYIFDEAFEEYIEEESKTAPMPDGVPPFLPRIFSSGKDFQLTVSALEARIAVFEKVDLDSSYQRLNNISQILMDLSLSEKFINPTSSSVTIQLHYKSLDKSTDVSRLLADRFSNTTTKGIVAYATSFVNHVNDTFVSQDIGQYRKDSNGKSSEEEFNSGLLDFLENKNFDEVGIEYEISFAKQYTNSPINRNHMFQFLKTSFTDADKYIAGLFSEKK